MLVTASIEVGFNGGGEKRSVYQEVALVERSAEGVISGRRDLRFIERQFAAVLHVYLELTAHSRGKLSAVDDDVALRMMKGRARSDIVRADRGGHVINDQILRVKRARFLPLEDLDAAFDEPAKMVAALPVHEAHQA